MNKIKRFLAELVFAPSGAALLIFVAMMLLSVFNFINSALLFANNAFMLLMIPAAFVVPYVLFAASRGGKEYVPTLNLSLPRKYHLLTVLLGALLLICGSTLLKFLFVSGKYAEFSLYGAFFAHRDGSLWRDLYLLLAFCLVPPIFEGLIFRGVLLKEHDKRGRLTAVIFSSLFYALLGFDTEHLAWRFFFSALLCIIVYATDSLALSVALHILYNVYAVFAEPTLISVKNVSSNAELFGYLLAIATLVIAIFLFSQLARLYRRYSHTKFGENFTKSTPRAKTFWSLIELLSSLPALLCYALFIVVTLILNI